MDVLEKYKKELDNDTKIDELNLKDVQMALPGIKHKWVSRLINHKSELNKLKSLREKAKKKIIEDLSTNSKTTLSLPTLERRADNHDLMKKIKKQMIEQELIIMYLEKIEQIFKSMSFDIKNLVEIMKMETM